MTTKLDSYEIDQKCLTLNVGESFKVGEWVVKKVCEENPKYEEGEDSWEPYRVHRGTTFHGDWDIPGDYICSEEEAIAEKED